MPPCLTLCNIKYVSRVKWSNPRKGVAPSPTSRCSSYWKGSLLVALDYGRQLLITGSLAYSIWSVNCNWCFPSAYTDITFTPDIGIMVRVFTNGSGDLGSIPGCVILKNLKMVLATSSLYTQQYKVSIKGKVEQSRERSSALPYISV